MGPFPVLYMWDDFLLPWGVFIVGFVVTLLVWDISCLRPASEVKTFSADIFCFFIFSLLKFQSSISETLRAWKVPWSRLDILDLVLEFLCTIKTLSLTCLWWCSILFSKYVIMACSAYFYCLDWFPVSDIFNLFNHNPIEKNTPIRIAIHMMCYDTYKLGNILQ